MSSLEPRGGGGRRVSRAQKEQRAFQLVVASGVFGVLGVVGVLLAIVGVGGLGLPLLALVIAAVCAVLFRRMTS
jgi:hypothetical protein